MCFVHQLWRLPSKSCTTQNSSEDVLKERLSTFHLMEQYGTWTWTLLTRFSCLINASCSQKTDLSLDALSSRDHLNEVRQCGGLRRKDEAAGRHACPDTMPDHYTRCFATMDRREFTATTPLYHTALTAILFYPVFSHLPSF